ncbi:DUF3293 domain-containing protein [Lewinella sp. IMCC34183]|uniref:DUF3293 domain-containing protein n=1 Tax=Lewinella sp. IMCC34183 TaxID=2248762 RepID=UPI000E27D861|nr:DUF3293 domain-containing protein [Lewinella sp. IMCC34183]
MPNPPSDQSASLPDERLAAAYRNARYVFNGFALQIDVPHPDFDRWLAHEGYHDYAFLTACNPRSKPLSATRNLARHGRLLALTGSLTHRGATGTDPDGRWPDEPGLLLLDAPREKVRDLGRRFGQYAIVEGEAGGSPRLYWL